MVLVGRRRQIIGGDGTLGRCRVGRLHFAHSGRRRIGIGIGTVCADRRGRAALGLDQRQRQLLVLLFVGQQTLVSLTARART